MALFFMLNTHRFTEFELRLCIPKRSTRHYHYRDFRLEIITPFIQWLSLAVLNVIKIVLIAFICTKKIY